MVWEFFRNRLISSKYQCETEPETQAETQTRKHAHDPLHVHVLTHVVLTGLQL